MTGNGPGSERGSGRTGAGTDEGEEGNDGRIRQLDRRTIDRIAAGEVVERPASAVKELVENALDADASRVRVAVERGGMDGIRVTDDGIGMSEEGVQRAVEKHTTSKIERIEDLERGVSSLGFRGEALAAIGAVSRVTIRTKPRGGTRGTELAVAGGEVESVSPIGCPSGTTVEVSDLFYNVPARKKYLKQEATEFAHVNRIVTGYALANPDVAIALEHGSREVFATSGSGTLREAVLATYGREVATAMIPLETHTPPSTPSDENGTDGENDTTGDSDEETDGDEGSDGSDDDGNTSSEDTIQTVGRVDGLVSDPETTRASATYVTTIVNGRYVTARTVREAILDAYGNQLAPDRYPFAVLDVEVPPTKIDVNVHPRKLEVRFEDERAVKEAVEERVERALLDEGLIRSGAPRGRSAPAQARIDPESEKSELGETESGDPEPATGQADQRADGRESNSEAADGTVTEGSSARTDSKTVSESGSESGGSGTSPTADTVGTTTGGDPVGNRGNDTEDEPKRHRPVRGEASGAASGDEGQPGVRGVGEPEPGLGNDRRGIGNEGVEDGTIEPSSAGEVTTAVDLEGVVDPHAHIDEGEARSEGTRRFEVTEQRALSGERVEDHREFERLPSMRVLGQFDETYVVAETADGLVLIDQHAADERVTYEHLRERLPRGEAQMLAEPVEIELTAGEAALFDSAIEAIAGLGFYASWAGSEGENGTDANDGGGEDGHETKSRRTIQVRTVPAAIAECNPALLRDVLSAFVSTERPETTIDAAADALLADLACYPSITAGTSLSTGSIVDLLGALDACENPYACPHGRPVVIEFSRREIDGRFERDYPGHAGRRSE